MMKIFLSEKLTVASFSENKLRRHLLFEEKSENIMEPIFQDLYQKNTKSDAGKSEFFNEGLVIDFTKNWSARGTLIPMNVYGFKTNSNGVFIDTLEDFTLAQHIYENER